MMTKLVDTTLLVAGLAELNASNAAGIRDEIRSLLTENVTTIDVDLSTTSFVDSSGLGALIALHKTMTLRGGAVRILRPRPTVMQILELTRLHRVLEIVNP
jgi:anti-anti-sigma factor